MANGLFITFEGGDGSGKSTQIQLLHDFLIDQGLDVILTREPGGTSISEQIREIILDVRNTAMSPVCETMLYAAARAQLVKELIYPALTHGQVVICDRFLDSSLAYQAYARNLGDMVSVINAFGVGDCIPDLTFYLRLNPQTSGKRISDRERDRMESESQDFHWKVYDGYERLAEAYPDRIVTIDARRSIADIAGEIREKVLERIHET